MKEEKEEDDEKSPAQGGIRTHDLQVLQPRPYLVDVASHQGRKEDLGERRRHRVHRRHDVRVHEVLQHTGLLLKRSQLILSEI